MSSLPPIPRHQVKLERSLPAVRDAVAPAGFSAPARMLSELSDKEHNLLSPLVVTVLEDPLLMQQVSDRVYELMQEEVERDRERQFYYGSEQWH